MEEREIDVRFEADADAHPSGEGLRSQIQRSRVTLAREAFAQQRLEVEARHRELLADVAVMFPTPAGRYVLEHGRWFIPRHRPTGVRKGSDKACYRNTGRYVLDHPEHRYVEGFAMSTNLGMVVQHAWAADSMDFVIDRTWKDPEDSLYFG
ncbi:MAG TPA: hypothetical protein VFE45_03125, partial [Coriobacteriia bacterium]|nr:hypothetical protein [Coriobacteriia bacterium]